jgi:hypothetical protein
VALTAGILTYVKELAVLSNSNLTFPFPLISLAILPLVLMV